MKEKKVENQTNRLMKKKKERKGKGVNKKNYTKISKSRKKNIRHHIIAIKYSAATQIINENELQSELLSKCRREGKKERRKEGK